MHHKTFLPISFCSCPGTGPVILIDLIAFVVVYRRSDLPIVLGDGFPLSLSVPRDMLFKHYGQCHVARA